MPPPAPSAPLATQAPGQSGASSLPEDRRPAGQLRRVLAARAAALLFAASCAPALAFELVSAEEATASRRMESSRTQDIEPMRGLSAPRIEVLRPDIGAGGLLSSPIPVEVRFHAGPGAKIVRESFRAFYGFFRLDVTERLLAHAEVTAQGIRVEDAQMPAGSHRLVLRIEDDRAGVGERELRFDIAR